MPNKKEIEANLAEAIVARLGGHPLAQHIVRHFMAHEYYPLPAGYMQGADANPFKRAIEGREVFGVANSDILPDTPVPARTCNQCGTLNVGHGVVCAACHYEAIT